MLAATLLQGVVLNLVLLIYMGLVYLPMLMFWRVRHSTAQLCLTCGYDLRATRAVCPECGVAIDPLDPTLVERRKLRLEALASGLVALPFLVDMAVIFALVLSE